MDSLSLLLPARRPQSSHANRKSTALEDRIRALTFRFISLVNDRDWSSPEWQLLSRDFEVEVASADSRHHGLANLSASSATAWRTNLQSHLASRPDQRFEIVECTVIQDDDGATVSAWLSIRTLGDNVAGDRDSLAVLQWCKKSKEVWKLEKQTVLNGPIGASW